jgi:hypothetical protein
MPEPAVFSARHNPACEEEPEGVPPFSSPCDSFRVVARNLGSAPSSGPITLTDQVPAGLQVVGVVLNEQQAGAARKRLECSSTPVLCEYAAPVPPGGELIMTINVVLESEHPASPVANSATLSEEGNLDAVSTATSSSEPNPLSGGTPEFRIGGFNVRVEGPAGQPDTQAGDHPYGVTTSFSVPSFTSENTYADNYQHLPTEEIKDLTLDLPAGLVGNPQSAPTCPLSLLVESIGNATTTTACPTASKVGIVSFETSGSFHTSNVNQSQVSALYNMVPEPGHPAEFGFTYLGQPIFFYASIVDSSAGYVLQISVPGLVGIPLNSVSLTLFGNPSVRDGSATSSIAFATNPVACSDEPLQASIKADTWEHPSTSPADWSQAETSAFSAVTGCEMLQFQPTISVTPETTQADEPSGYQLDVKVPQAPDSSPDLASSDLKRISVTLPPGVSVSPTVADGLQACDEAAFEPAASVTQSCPPASQIGTLEIATPLLSQSLSGQLYLGTPACAPCESADAADGRLLRVFAQAEGSGVVVKLRGTVTIDPGSGQLTASFDRVPQLPFGELRLRFKGGPRAVLANPQTCATAATTSSLEPWSAPEVALATPSSLVSYDWDAAQGACPPLPFTPGFNAGVSTPLAGASSPFTLTFSRGDRQQDLAGISATAPPGVTAMLSQAPECPEPEAAQGTCSPASQLGTTSVAAGAGSHPLWLSGQVYLTGPYDGAPFGLAIAVPAKVGPLDLGTIVLRAAVAVDPRTAALTITSTDLPQSVAGVPLRLQIVSLDLNRPGFILNPTRCSPRTVSATIASAQGASAPASSPFAVSGCAHLPFKPKLTALVKDNTSQTRGVDLHVVLAGTAGDANIGSAEIQLPKQLPARLSTIQKACPARIFEADPAACGAASRIGVGTVYTPILGQPLVGPGYLVSHGREYFPSLVFVLQSQGVVIDLTALLAISKQGVTTSTFASVPDVPIKRFDLMLPKGPASALAARGNLCATPLSMPTTIVGQNGVKVKDITKIAVSGCPKHKSKAKKTKTAKKRQPGKKKPTRK